jgi:hypothetical protein
MKNLFENFRHFVTEAEEKAPPKIQPEMEDALESKGFTVGQFLGGGKFGKVYEISKGDQSYAAKIVASAWIKTIDKEVENYKWVKDNRSRLDAEISKHLPVVYFAEIINGIGVIIMELLKPDVYKMNMALFTGGAEEVVDRDTGKVKVDRTAEWGNIQRAERLLSSPEVREDIAKNMARGLYMTWLPYFSKDPNHEDYLSDEDFQNMINDVIQQANVTYSNIYSEISRNIGKARRGVARAEQGIGTKAADKAMKKLNFYSRTLIKPGDLTNARLMKFEFWAKLFVKVLIDAYKQSDLVEKLKTTGPPGLEYLMDGMLGDSYKAMESDFIRWYTRSITPLGPESTRDFQYQPKAALERFPEVRGIINAMNRLEKEEGFTAKDVHIFNVMYSKTTNEMVIVDLGLFDIKPKPKPKKPASAHVPGVTDFVIQENNDHDQQNVERYWPQIIKLSAVDFDQTKALGESLFGDGFEYLFYKKLLQAFQNQWDEGAPLNEEELGFSLIDIYFNEHNRNNVQKIYDTISRKFGEINAARNNDSDGMVPSAQASLYGTLRMLMNELYGLVMFEEGHPFHGWRGLKCGKQQYLTWKEALWNSKHIHTSKQDVRHMYEAMKKEDPDYKENPCGE